MVLNTTPKRFRLQSGLNRSKNRHRERNIMHKQGLPHPLCDCLERIIQQMVIYRHMFLLDG